MAVSLRDYSKSLEASLNSGSGQGHEMQHLRALYEDSQGKLYEVSEQRKAVATELEHARNELKALYEELGRVGNELAFKRRQPAEAAQAQPNPQTHNFGMQTSPNQPYNQPDVQGSQQQRDPQFGQRTQADPAQSHFGQQQQSPPVFGQPQEPFRGVPAHLQPQNTFEHFQRPVQNQQYQQAQQPFQQQPVSQPVDSLQNPYSARPSSQQPEGQPPQVSLSTHPDFAELVAKLISMLTARTEQQTETPEVAQGGTQAQGAEEAVSSEMPAALQTQDGIATIRSMLEELLSLQKTKKPSAATNKDISKSKSKGKSKKKRVSEVTTDDSMVESADVSLTSVDSASSGTVSDSLLAESDEDDITYEPPEHRHGKIKRRAEPRAGASNGHGTRDRNGNGQRQERPRRMIDEVNNAMNNRQCQVCSQVGAHSHSHYPGVNGSSSNRLAQEKQPGNAVPSGFPRRPGTQEKVAGSASGVETGRWEEEATPRPFMQTEEAVKLIVAKMGSEFSSLKEAYADLIDAYNGANPSKERTRRHEIALELKSLVDEMESKADQIYAMYDVLAATNLAGPEDVDFNKNNNDASNEGENNGGLAGNVLDGVQDNDGLGHADSLMGQYSWIN